MVTLDRLSVNFKEDCIVEDLEFDITFDKDLDIVAEAIMNFKGNEAISNYADALYHTIPMGSKIHYIGIGLTIISDYDGNIVDYTDTNNIRFSTDGDILKSDARFVDDVFMPVVLDDIKKAYTYNEDLAQLYPSKNFNYIYKYFNSFGIKKITKILDEFYKALTSPVELDKVVLSSKYGTMQSDLPVKVQIDRLLASEKDYIARELKRLDQDVYIQMIMDSYDRITNGILDDILKEKDDSQ